MIAGTCLKFCVIPSPCTSSYVESPYHQDTLQMFLHTCQQAAVPLEQPRFFAFQLIKSVKNGELRSSMRTKFVRRSPLIEFYSTYPKREILCTDVSSQDKFQLNLLIPVRFFRHLQTAPSLGTYKAGGSIHTPRIH